MTDPSWMHAASGVNILVMATDGAVTVAISRGSTQAAARQLPLPELAEFIASEPPRVGARQCVLAGTSEAAALTMALTPNGAVRMHTGDELGITLDATAVSELRAYLGSVPQKPVSRYEAQLAEAEKRFTDDIGEDVSMSILRSDGPYRHLRFSGAGPLHTYDVHTWPNGLAIRGDGPNFMLSLHPTDDVFYMIRNSSHGGINPSYWQEKVFAGQTRGFSEVLFSRWIAEEAKTAEARHPGAVACLEELIDDGAEVYCEVTAREFLSSLEHDTWFPEFPPPWVHDLTEYTWEWLWACHALVHAVRLWDEEAGQPQPENRNGHPATPAPDPGPCGSVTEDWTCALPLGPHPGREHRTSGGGTWEQTLVTVPEIPHKLPRYAAERLRALAQRASAGASALATPKAMEALADWLESIADKHYPIGECDPEPSPPGTGCGSCGGTGNRFSGHEMTSESCCCDHGHCSCGVCEFELCAADPAIDFAEALLLAIEKEEGHHPDTHNEATP